MGTNMKKPKHQKLTIRTETVRVLSHYHMRGVAGGLPSGSVPYTTAHSDVCPTTSNDCSTRCDVTNYCPDTGFTCTF